MSLLTALPPSSPLVVIATGKYVGEGFDYPRLDTLMLALPIVWKGLIAQYAGRLHREYDGKKDVRIYDYVDLHVPMTERMYRKHLKGYASIGYAASTATSTPTEIQQSLFNGDTYFSQFTSDILHHAQHSIIVAQPKLWLPRHAPMLDILRERQAQGIEISLLTNQESDYAERLNNIGLNTAIIPDLTLTFTILDKSLVWYGSMNFLANCRTDEYAIRINDKTFANELLHMTITSKYLGRTECSASFFV